MVKPVEYAALMKLLAESQGARVGLTLVKSLVEMHGCARRRIGRALVWELVAGLEHFVTCLDR